METTFEIRKHRMSTRCRKYEIIATENGRFTVYVRDFYRIAVKQGITTKDEAERLIASLEYDYKNPS